jgi:hypothetical protein
VITEATVISQGCGEASRGESRWEADDVELAARSVSTGTINIRTQHSAPFAPFMTNGVESEIQKSMRWFGISATWREGGQYDVAGQGAVLDFPELPASCRAVRGGAQTQIRLRPVACWRDRE